MLAFYDENNINSLTNDVIMEFILEQLRNKLVRVDSIKSHWEHQIKVEMNNFPSKFCFIRCLHKADQSQFISWYADQMSFAKISKCEKNNIIKSGGMLMSVWIGGMQKLTNDGKLQHSYSLFRHAYWGENRSGKKSCRMNTSYTVQLKEFTSVSSEKRIYLLYNDSNIKQIAPSLINPSLKVDETVNVEALNADISSRKNKSSCVMM
jgi:hypothetical protein